jgi:hypothetical protein
VVYWAVLDETEIASRKSIPFEDFEQPLSADPNYINYLKQITPNGGNSKSSFVFFLWCCLEQRYNRYIQPDLPSI